MKNKTLHIVSAYLLVIAMFTPTFLAIADYGEDRIALVNPMEEEPGKEEKKDLREMDVFFELARYSKIAEENETKTNTFFYVFKSSDFLQKIILPPPETLS